LFAHLVLFSHLNEVSGNFNLLVEFLSLIGDELGGPRDRQNPWLVFAPFCAFGLISEFHPFLPPLDYLWSAWVNVTDHFNLGANWVSLCICGFDLFDLLFFYEVAHRHGYLQQLITILRDIIAAKSEFIWINR
jgi:hypothetical protein